MKNWKNKTDYWPVALATMVTVLAAIALIDVAAAWFGTGVFAGIFG